MPKLGENYLLVELRAGARQGSVRKLERGTIERAIGVSQPLSPRGLLPLRDETRPGFTATPGSGFTAWLTPGGESKAPRSSFLLVLLARLASCLL